MGYNLTSDHIKMAQRSEALYGVPASVTLGQFILESGAGTSDLFKSSNNGFGITGSYQGDYVMTGGRKWRAYSSLAKSFDDHGALLAKPLYASKTKNATTVSEYVDAIAETYAPASDGNNGYASTLKKIIADNNLTQYDGRWQGQAGDLAGGTAETEEKSSGVMSSILRTVIKAGAYLFLFVLAVFFFINAFDLPSPKEAAVKMVAKKVTEE